MHCNFTYFIYLPNGSLSFWNGYSQIMVKSVTMGTYEQNWRWNSQTLLLGRLVLLNGPFSKLMLVIHHIFYQEISPGYNFLSSLNAIDFMILGNHKIQISMNHKKIWDGRLFTQVEPEYGNIMLNWYLGWRSDRCIHSGFRG